MHFDDKPTITSLKNDSQCILRFEEGKICWKASVEAYFLSLNVLEVFVTVHVQCFRHFPLASDIVSIDRTLCFKKNLINKVGNSILIFFDIDYEMIFFMSPPIVPKPQNCGSPYYRVPHEQ